MAVGAQNAGAISIVEEDKIADELMLVGSDFFSKNAQGRIAIAGVGGNLLGIVLNNINMTSDESYYYYSGYYYDYYGKESETLPDHAAKADKAPARETKSGAEATGESGGIKPKY